MSRPMQIITYTLRILKVVIAMTCHAKRPNRILSLLPNTIASVAELFDGSAPVAEQSSENG